MRGFVANTDYDWFTFLRSAEQPVEEVNFWRPASDSSFKALQSGEPFFFKLKSPHNAIGGFGYFAHFSNLPLSLAWQVFGQGNGAPNFALMRERLLHFRSRFRMDLEYGKDFSIGCILINEPLFFDRKDWIRIPEDFAPNIVQGKTYDLATGEGERLWLECVAREREYRSRTASKQVNDRESLIVAETQSLLGGYGPPALIRPRLGQGSFRVAVLDTYDRRCSVTGERTLPALEAAHIREFHEIQEHAIPNGILLRADIHKLFGAGYVTVTPQYTFEVSRRIKEEFENGRDYYALHGSTIRLPANVLHHPLPDALIWHNENRFRG